MVHAFASHMVHAFASRTPSLVQEHTHDQSSLHMCVPQSGGAAATSFHVTVPGTVKISGLELPGGSYEFGVGGAQSDVHSAEAPQASAPAQHVQSYSHAPQESPQVETQSAPAAEQPAEAQHEEEGILSSKTDMDNGVNTDEVSQAALELQKRLIDELMKQATASGQASAEVSADGSGQEKSAREDDVLDSKTGMSTGIDKAAVSCLPPIQFVHMGACVRACVRACVS
jgi:hypothetical protein